jgi:hypothetical protein
MLAKRRGQSNRERHIAQPSTFGHRDVTFPVRALHAQLPLVQIDIAPLQRHHLATPQSGVASQEHDEMRASIERLRGID